MAESRSEGTGMAANTDSSLDAEKALAALEFERSLAKRITIFVPIVTVVAAVGFSTVNGLGGAILVLAAGAFLFSIFQLWWSLRTLAGDAPLEAGFVAETLASEEASLEEAKRAILRTLKDLDHEKSIGRLTDQDYEELASAYRDEAKEIFRKIDALGASEIEHAERLLAEHIAGVPAKTKKKRNKSAPPKEEKGVPADDSQAQTKEDAPSSDEASDGPSETEAKPASAEPPTDSRVKCGTCGALNEPDATFCKKCGKPMDDHA